MKARSMLIPSRRFLQLFSFLAVALSAGAAQGVCAPVGQPGPQRIHAATRWADLAGGMPFDLVCVSPTRTTIIRDADLMPPSPRLLERLRQQGISPADLAQRMSRGSIPIHSSGPLRGPAPASVKSLVLMVDFSDKASIFTKTNFQNMLFSQNTYSGGSLRDYYKEVSYGKFDLQGNVEGWFRAPQTCAYYADGQSGTGAYPRNAQKLVEDTLDLADATVDFRQYDVDGDGWIDGLFVIHAGAGAEETGDGNDIWSHKWGINTKVLDGIRISTYAMQPELNAASATGMATIGVFAHEFGHVLGLPDLYDTDYSSEGVGDWSLMAGGSWGGARRDGATPTHPDAWCKEQLGWINPTVLTQDTPGVSLPRVETNPVVYKLWTRGTGTNEYFLVENRQKTGFDAYAPGAGFVIYHVDNNQSTNKDENHYKVAVEQADGTFDLESGRNRGDAGDPWPGSGNKRTFGDTSTPNSRSYANLPTSVEISNISDSGSTMTADMEVVGSKCDLLIKLGSEADTAYAVNNDYQNVPSGDQIETASVNAGQTATFNVKVENDDTSSTTLMVKATETTVSGWTVTYKVGATDITANIKGAGYTTGTLFGGASEVITISMTPDAGAAGGATKGVVLNLFQDGADTVVRDAVEARTTVALQDQPDLLIKTTAEADTEYQIDNTYQTTPDGGQIETQSADPSLAASYSVKLQNDGNSARTFVLKTTESAETGWTITYKIGLTDITTQMRSGTGYVTPTLASGASMIVSVSMRPDVSVPGKTTKSATIAAYLTSGSTTVLDSVQAVALVQSVDKCDLLIKAGGEPDSAYAIDNTYQTTPAGNQIEASDSAAGTLVTYYVRVQNDSNSTRTFVVKAVENAEAGWTVNYKVGAVNITSAILGAGGRITGSLAPGNFETITIEMTASPGQTGGSVKTTTLKTYLDGTDPQVLDAVQATTTIPNVEQPDFMIRTAAETDADYAGNGVYQTTPNGVQVKMDQVNAGSTATYLVKMENDGNTDRTFVVKCAETGESNWSIVYKVGSNDVSDLLRGSGYLTSTLVPGASVIFTVEVTPSGLVTGGTTKSTTLKAYLDGAATVVKDSVQAVTSVTVVSQPDLLVKANTEGDVDYAIDGTYQQTPAGAQVEAQSVDRLLTATYQVKVQNDGNTTRSFVLKAVEDATAGWTVVYKKADNTDISAAIRGVGYVTSMLARDAQETITVQMTPAAGAVGGSVKGATIRALLSGSDPTVRDSVRVETTVNAYEQPDLLIRRSTETDAAYGINNEYQTDAPAGAQIEAQNVMPGGTVTYLVKVENDGNTTRTFCVRATESADAGWNLLYKVGINDITAAITGVDGYTTGNLAPGGSEVITLAMTPTDPVIGGTTKSAVFSVALDGVGAAKDRVQATTTLGVVDKADLLVKLGGEGDASYGLDNTYQTSVASGDQTETQTVAVNTAAAYQVKIENDGNAARGFVLKATETAETGWTVVYKKADGTDISAEMRSAGGYAIANLGRAANEVITVEMTPDATVVGGTAKSATVKAYLAASDVTAQDTVSVTATLGVVSQPDLLVKRATEDESAYATNDVYLTAAGGDQIESLQVGPTVTAFYQMKLENDGNTARTFVLKASDGADANWTFRYKVGATDITSAIRGPSGYTTASLARGGSLLVTVEVTPDRLAAGGSSKSATVAAYLDGSDTTVRDLVQMVTTVDVVEQADLLVKLAGESDDAYGLNDVYQTAPSGDQVEAQLAAEGVAAGYQIRVQNDGNMAARAFVLRAAEQSADGWAVVYRKADGTDISAQMRDPAGYTTGLLNRGGVEVINVSMTAGASVVGGARVQSTVTVSFSGDPTVKDAVELSATLSVVTQADLLIKAASQDDSAYAVANTFQATPAGEQVETIHVGPGVAASYLVKVANVGNTSRGVVLKTAETSEAGWIVTYKVGDTDISASLRGEGYATTLERGASQTIAVEMRPDPGVVGGTGKSATLGVYYAAGDPAPTDSVQAVALVDIVERPDLLIKPGGQPDTAYAANDVYQATPAGDQVLTGNVARATGTSYQIKVENDGNTTRTYVLRATESTESLWTVVYKNGTTDISSMVRGTGGYTTPPLARGESHTITVEVGPDAAVPGGSAKTFTVNVYLGMADTTPLDSVQARTTVDVVAQPDLLVKAGTEFDSAFAANNVYQMEPSGDQLESATGTPTQPGIFAVRIQNDGNTPRTYVLRATESEDTGWTVAYTTATADIGAAIRAPEGFTTVQLTPGDVQTVIVQMTPQKAVTGGSTKRVTLKAYLDSAGEVRDAVQLTCSAGVARQADLLIKAAGEDESAFGANDVYQTSPSLEQVESISVGSGTAASYSIRVQNDGNTAVTGFILKAEESSGPGWTLTYRVGATEITSQITGTGYVLGSLSPGASETLTLQMTPGASVARGSSKSVVVRAYLDGSDTTARDAVQAITRVVNRVPAVPEMVSPAAGAIVSPTPTFKVKSTDPDADKVKFLVELKQGESSETLSVGETVSGQEATLALPAERTLRSGQWQWRVKAIDAVSGESEWSESRSFTVNRRPVAVQLLTPADKSVVSPAPELTMKATDPDGDRVRVTVELTRGSTTKSFELPAADSGAEVKLALPADQALAPGEWQWRAKAADSNNDVGDWSAARTLNVPSSLPALTQSAGLSGFGLAVGSAGLTPAQLGLQGARLATWDPVHQRYLQDGEVTELRPGQGCWVRTDSPLPVQFAGTAITEPFAIPLSRGWNLISPPFLSALDWNLNALKVRRNGEERSLAGAMSAGWMADYALVWRQDPANPNTGKYVLIYDSWVMPGVPNQLEPWKAYWVRAYTDCELVLPPPGRSADAGRVRRAPVQGWSVRLQAASRRGSGEVVLGVSTGREFFLGLPPAPPTDEAPMSVALSGARGQASVDVRAASQTGALEWELVVTAAEGRAAGEAENVTLSWPDLRALPRDTSLTLVDTATGASRYLRTAAAYSFRLSEGSRRFRVIAERQIGPAVAITGLAMEPLRSSARVIRFTLSRAATTDVCVMRPDGRVVAVVAEGRAAEAGLNQVVCAQDLRPGMYLIRVTARTWNDARAQAVLPVVIVR